MTTGIVYWYFVPGHKGSAEKPIALPPGLVRRSGENVNTEIAGAAFMHFREQHPDQVPPAGVVIALRVGDRWPSYNSATPAGTGGTAPPPRSPRTPSQDPDDHPAGGC